MLKKLSEFFDNPKSFGWLLKRSKKCFPKLLTFPSAITGLE